MAVIVWTAAGFLSGSIPFAVILGWLARRADIRAWGDHNPGGTNVIRAAGWRWGLLAILLDFLKGALPVGLAWYGAGLQGWEIVPPALAPAFGHAFSPWLGGRGGKAVAVTFGLWSGLTIWSGPSVLGLLLGVSYALFASSGWAVMSAMLGFGVFVGLVYAPLYPEFLAIWVLNLALLGWKHRQELTGRPELRPRLALRLRSLPWFSSRT